MSIASTCTCTCVLIETETRSKVKGRNYFYTFFFLVRVIVHWTNKSVTHRYEQLAITLFYINNFIIINLPLPFETLLAHALRKLRAYIVYKVAVLISNSKLSFCMMQKNITEKYMYMCEFTK